MLHWIQSALHCMCSSSFLFLRICQYDIFLVWFDFSIFVCITHCTFLLKLQNKIWLWRWEKIARDNIITTFKLFKKKKKLRRWPIFSLWTPTNWELTSLIRWRDRVLHFWVDCTKFFNTPSNLSGTQLNNSDLYCEIVPCKVNLLVDQSYANYFQSFKCSGSITENRRW